MRNILLQPHPKSSPTSRKLAAASHQGGRISGEILGRGWEVVAAQNPQSQGPPAPSTPRPPPRPSKEKKTIRFCGSFQKLLW